MTFDFDHEDFDYVVDPGSLTVESGITTKDVLDFLIAFWRRQIEAGWSMDLICEKVWWNGFASARLSKKAKVPTVRLRSNTYVS